MQHVYTHYDYNINNNNNNTLHIEYTANPACVNDYLTYCLLLGCFCLHEILNMYELTEAYVCLEKGAYHYVNNIYV